MDCLEFRRHLLAEPNSRDPGFVAHRQACPECRKAAERAGVFEGQLKEAFEVPVPDELANRILLGQTTTARRSRLRNGWLMALAATVVIGIGLTAVMLPTAHAGLERFVVDHALHEPEALVSTEDVSPEEVRATFETYGVDLDGDVDGVTFVAPCDMYNGPGVHLVVRDDDGPPVTVMYMPDVELDRRLALNLEGFQGVIMPLARGVLAVVGYEGQALDGVEAIMRRALDI